MHNRFVVTERSRRGAGCMSTQVKFKGQWGSLWLIAEVVEKVDGGYILNCGETQGFFIEDRHVRPYKKGEE